MRTLLLVAAIVCWLLAGGLFVAAATGGLFDGSSAYAGMGAILGLLGAICLGARQEA